jgi:protocatechuate 3,4-dioxygenase beta subunit
MHALRGLFGRTDPARRALAAAGVSAMLLSAWLAAGPAGSLAAPAQPAPAAGCTPGGRPTPAQTEGPFFKAGAPQRASLLEPGVTGTKPVVTGFVLTTDCRPVSGARLDFWQADDRGQYDNAGFRLRGHQLTDGAGRYQLETIVPGLYTGRTRHIHVKVQAANLPPLTTQLYIPGEARNQSDGIYNPALLVAVRDAADGKLATFTFVLSSR